MGRYNHRYAFSFMPNNAHILGYALRELSLKRIGRQLHESTTYVE